MSKTLIPFSQLNIKFPLLLPPNENQLEVSPRTPLIQNLELQEYEIHVKVEMFFKEMIWEIPRQSFIRKMLLLIFPKGHRSISVRKIQRNSMDELLLLVGNNIMMIKSHFSQEIQWKWFHVCIEKVSKIKRSHQSDFTILHVAREKLKLLQKSE
jgi:hypothetical protein